MAVHMVSKLQVQITFNNSGVKSFFELYIISTSLCDQLHGATKFQVNFY